MHPLYTYHHHLHHSGFHGECGACSCQLGGPLIDSKTEALITLPFMLGAIALIWWANK